MADADVENFLVILSYHAKRRLSAAELSAAMGLSRSSFYERLKSGALVTADNIVKVSRHLGLNPIDLLLEFNILTREDLATARR